MVRRRKQLNQPEIQRTALHLLRIKQHPPIIIPIRRSLRLKRRTELLEPRGLTVHREIMRSVDYAALRADQLQRHLPVVLALHPERGTVRHLIHGDPCIAGVREAHEACSAGGHRDLQRGVDGLAHDVVGVELDVHVANGLVGCEVGVGALEAVVLEELAVNSAVACFFLSCCPYSETLLMSQYNYLNDPFPVSPSAQTPAQSSSIER